MDFEDKEKISYKDFEQEVFAKKTFLMLFGSVQFGLFLATPIVSHFKVSFAHEENLTWHIRWAVGSHVDVSKRMLSLNATNVATTFLWPK